MSEESRFPEREALEAVRAAARACRAVRARLVRPETLEKKDRSPVTVADFASQAVVCALLRDSVPSIPVVGEEDAAELRLEGQGAIRRVVVEQVGAALGREVDEDAVLDWIDLGGAAPAPGGRYWTLDPIDGTKGFLRGEHYAVALGLIEGGKVILGALACPGLETGGGEGALLLAGRGGGARILPLDGDDEEGTPLRVSPVSDPASARFCESVESAHSDQSWSVKVARSLGISGEPVRMDSQAKYAAVARGDASIYLRLPTRPGYQEKIWDHAAGSIVVEEAGGRVTDITGTPLDFGQGRTLSGNRGVVATNGRIHDAVIEAIGRSAE